MKDLHPVKKYTPPKLEVYGDIRTITQNVATAGNYDGTMTPPRRTQS